MLRSPPSDPEPADPMPAGPPRPFERPVRLREVRLVSGLVLAAFLLTHFANHALGLVSLEAMEAGRGWFNRVWRNPAGTVLLYGAALTHFVLALAAIYRRRTLRMPAREAAQLAFGIALPFLLIPHVAGTRIEYALTGQDTGYPEMVHGLWIAAPENGLRQTVALVLAWLHGCLGLYFWLRPKPWFGRWSLVLYTAALLVPLLALLGFAEAGEEMARLGSPPEPEAPPPILADIRTALYLGAAGLVAAAFAARALRVSWNWSTRLRVTYPGGRVVTVPRGFSVLEASRSAGIPHNAICGGRGRCSTCRVRVTEGLERQPPPSAQERATLQRIKAGPNVRLACQFRPVQDLAVVPVLSRSLDRPLAGERAIRGQEREIAVLFCDLRGFTSLSEKRLPFDTVFILNRYFEAVGEAVEEASGHMDKFIGDGALALFGLAADPRTAARQAVDAALRIRAGVDQLNATYASELDRPLQIAISLHAGPAVVGEMGYGAAMSLTAVGDTINTASRLEGLAKDLDAELVVSEDLARLAGLDLAGLDRQTLAVRGRSEPVGAWVFPEVRALAARLGAEAS
ncbi:MAG TPA: adenylate/guanylate cyclase domain-containing protein [Microvirga sp.]|nr:adenylate/guanylate cyclase domain-containing protein [Microvirga sp.]